MISYIDFEIWGSFWPKAYFLNARHRREPAYSFSPPLCWCGFKRCSKRELPHWTQRILFCNKDFFKQLFNLSSSTVEEFYYMRASNWDFGHMVKCDIYSAYYTTAFQEEQQIFWVKRIIFPCVWKKINRVHESAIKHMV